MIRLIWTTSVATRTLMRRYLPTNILLDAIRTRRGLKWGVPAMVLAVPYLYLASLCHTLTNHGGPSWLHLLVLLFIWNTLKFLAIGPWSVAMLVRTRVREARRGPDIASSPSPNTALGRPATSVGAAR